MQFIVYDFEVFSKDWLVVFKKGEEITVIHNDRDTLYEYYNNNKDNIFVGFNNKHYDDYIFKGILSDLDPKKISDFIIRTNKFGWEYPGMGYMTLNTFDTKQDITGNLSLSLKEAEGNMGVNIEETPIDFDKKEKLSKDELDLVTKYCKTDVINTEKILILRKNDISTRMELLNMFDLPITCIGKTNAKLTATILNARKKDRYDELQYDFPDNLELRNEQIKSFYSNEINYSDTLVTNICGVEHTLAYGGLHGAKPGIFEGNIWYIDVKSYYPTLMLKYNYISRNLKDPSKYKEIYDLRMQYKAEKNPKERALKLLLNTTYGAMKNKYNDLYDPKQANQVCITGQLFLLDLLEKLEPYIELIQSNTDGLIFICHNEEECHKILKSWELRTGLDLELDKVKKIWQKNVNNYILVKNDKLIVKGSDVKDSTGGTFFQNTTTILDKAIVNYFINNTLPEYTINECDDLSMFQHICKRGPTYLHVEQDGVLVNNCNRVFATKDTSLGNLYKVKSDGRKDSIANLPEHCIIINEDLTETKFSCNDIDKDWYIKEAYRKINDFLTKE